MSKLRAILVDDESACLVALQADLQVHCPEVEIVGTYDSPKDAIKGVHDDKPDLVFLDIDMPYINGFELLEMVHEVDFEVIFTTAFDQYAVQAFKISALDYLLKPIDPAELKAAVEKAGSVRRKGLSRQHLQFLKAQRTDLEQNAVKKVAFPTSAGIEFIPLDDIIYCKSDGSYSWIHRASGNDLYIAKTLRYLQEMLSDYNFIRVHNSFLVNTRHIERYVHTDGGMLIMSNGHSVKVSRIKKEALMKLF